MPRNAKKFHPKFVDPKDVSRRPFSIRRVGGPRERGRVPIRDSLRPSVVYKGLVCTTQKPRSAHEYDPCDQFQTPILDFLRRARHRDREYSISVENIRPLQVTKSSLRTRFRGRAYSVSVGRSQLSPPELHPFGDPGSSVLDLCWEYPASDYPSSSLRSPGIERTRPPSGVPGLRGSAPTRRTGIESTRSSSGVTGFRLLYGSLLTERNSCRLYAAGPAVVPLRTHRRVHLAHAPGYTAASTPTHIHN